MIISSITTNNKTTVISIVVIYRITAIFHNVHFRIDINSIVQTVQVGIQLWRELRMRVLSSLRRTPASCRLIRTHTAAAAEAAVEEVWRTDRCDAFTPGSRSRPRPLLLLHVTSSPTALVNGVVSITRSITSAREVQVAVGSHGVIRNAECSQSLLMMVKD